MLSSIYWLSIRCYALVIGIAAAFNPKARLFIKGRRNLLPKIGADFADEQRPAIWMHCASLGEFEQGRPVLESIRQRYPHYVYVVTFFSPSGYEVRKDYAGADRVYYLPLDSRQHATAFLDAIRPALCLFVKYEFWYFYLSTLAQRNIPTVLISAIFRSGQPFFKWYGSLQRKMLHAFGQIFVQDTASQHLLADLGFTSVTVSGDTRFDRVATAAASWQRLSIIESFAAQAKTIVAGSTWRDDERLLAEAYKELHNCKLILAPHEVDEKHIAEIEKQFGDSIKWSEWNGQTNKKVLIVDKVGLLLQIYGHADIAYIGGGFGKEGVHNVLEAAVYGVPCLFGPIYHQFLEAQELIQAEGAFAVRDVDEFLKKTEDLFSNLEMYQDASFSAKNYVQEKCGATAIIIGYIEAKKLLSMF